MQYGVCQLQECVAKDALALQQQTEDIRARVCQHLDSLLDGRLIYACEHQFGNVGEVTGLYAESWETRFYRFMQLVGDPGCFLFAQNENLETDSGRADPKNYSLTGPSNVENDAGGGFYSSYCWVD